MYLYFCIIIHIASLCIISKLKTNAPVLEVQMNVYLCMWDFDFFVMVIDLCSNHDLHVGYWHSRTSVMASLLLLGIS